MNGNFAAQGRSIIRVVVAVVVVHNVHVGAYLLGTVRCHSVVSGAVIWDNQFARDGGATRDKTRVQMHRVQPKSLYFNVIGPFPCFLTA